MDTIIKLYFRQRIDLICKSSQSVPIGESTSAENVESVNVSKEFLEILNMSFELKTCADTRLKKKDPINTLESKIEILFQNIITLEAEEKDRKFDDIIALAITYFNLGLIYSDTELQDLIISETYFTICMTLLKGKELERKAIVTIIRVLIKLNIISHKRKQPEKSCLFLNTAMELYSKYTKEKIEYPDPINFNALLGMDDEDKNSKIILENLQLTTLLNMSILYEENFRDMHKFVRYVHYILDQLTETVSYTFIAYTLYWAMTSSHLSRYFIYNYRFPEARNHMIAAEYMIKMFHEQVIEPLSNEEIDAELYLFLHKLYKTGYNNVLKFWGVYGAELLTVSTKGLLQIEENNKSCETDNSKSESLMESEKNVTKLLIFTDVRKEFEDFTARFPDKCVSNLNDAKTIFVDVLKCFDTVKKYFTVKEYLADCVEIAIATSKVYKSLATFEQDESKQIKLHTRRIIFLASMCNQVKEIVTNLCRERLRIPLSLHLTTIKLLNEQMGSDITILDIRTDNLQLNVEQLNRDFTDEMKINIKQSIIHIITNILTYYKLFSFNNYK